MEGFFKDYNAPTDKKVIKALIKMYYEDIDQEFHPSIYSLIENEPQAKYAFSLKLYEYIACELPILAVADDDSAASMLVMKNKMGVSLNWDDVKGNENLKNALLNIIENHTLYSQNVSEYYRNNLSKFDRSTGLNVLHTEIFKILK